jgi:hypothetical protein
MKCCVEVPYHPAVPNQTFVIMAPAITSQTSKLVAVILSDAARMEMGDITTV